MATTQLSPIATPGKPYSFSPKTSAIGKGTGPFTALSALGVPGAIHSFAAKTPADGAGPHDGLFTALSVVALPGGRHVFIAKEIAEAVEKIASGGGQYVSRQTRLYKRIIQEDKEMLETIIQSFISGIFDE